MGLCDFPSGPDVLLGTVADQLNKILGATVSNTGIAPGKSTGTGCTVTGAILLAPAILGGFFGFAWIVMFYVSQGTLPIAALGSWNLLGGGFFFVTGIPMLIAGVLLLVSGSRQRRRVWADSMSKASPVGRMTLNIAEDPDKDQCLLCGDPSERK